jgi:ABC-type sugar transport system ATPase subunit
MTLKIDTLSLRAGLFNVGPVDLDIKKGEYLVIMGPNGSGKSLLLKAICGIHSIEGGKIFIAGKDVTNLSPRKRKIGYVPQNSDLFPNMSVKKNIQFSLKVRGTGEVTAGKRVAEIAGILKIEHLLDRSTHHLSGGERQKVALARALASDPELLVLDEPVSAVDESARSEICNDLLFIQKKFQITTIHVCHSKDETQSVADRVGIMNNGVLQKVITSAEFRK